ncbi:MAG: site-specific integrase [Rhodocyclaceae bacterium]|nr:site-specific integrase [Rhodocyclaceae bacterium]
MSTDLEILGKNAAKSGARALPSVLDELEAEAQRIEKLAQAQTTQAAYQAAWRHFEDWCREMGLTSLPTNAATVRGYVTYLQQTNIPDLKPPRKYSISTIEQRLAAIKKCHLVAGHPLDLSGLGELRKGLRHDKADKKIRRSQKKALLDTDMIEILRRMSGSLPDLRDRVILLLGFVGAMRRSEIADIDVEHIEFVKGGAKIELLKSKGDRKSEGVMVNLVASARPILCAVQALKDWLAASAIESGPLLREIDRFGYIGSDRLTTYSIRNIVIKRAAAAGYTSNISTHSLRRGAVTAALQSGAPIQKVSKHVRHKSVQMTMRYYDDVQGIEDNAMIAVLGTAHENDPPAPVPMKRGDEVPRGEVIDYDEFAKAPSDPIKVNRIELREVDTSALQESIADVDALNKRLAEKLGVLK